MELLSWDRLRHPLILRQVMLPGSVTWLSSHITSHAGLFDSRQVMLSGSITWLFSEPYHVPIRGTAGDAAGHWTLLHVSRSISSVLKATPPISLKQAIQFDIILDLFPNQNGVGHEWRGQ